MEISLLVQFERERGRYQRLIISRSIRPDSRRIREAMSEVGKLESKLDMISCKELLSETKLFET